MTIGSGLVAHLLADSTITAVVGQRVRLDHAASGDSRPWVIVKIEDDRYIQHAGGGAALADAMVEIDCESTTPTLSEALAELVRLSVQDFVGTMGSVTVKSVVDVSVSRKEFRQEPGKETGYPARTVSGTVWYVCANPA